MTKRLLFFLLACLFCLSTVSQAKATSTSDKNFLECSKQSLLGSSPTQKFPIVGGDAPFASQNVITRAGWSVRDNQIETIINHKWLTLLPNKKLIVGKANVEERLNCNLSSLEVMRIIEKKEKTNSLGSQQIAKPGSNLTNTVAEASNSGATQKKSELLTLKTTKGQIVIELLPDLAPKHIERIKKLTRSGFYDGVIFHRVIPGFMAQTGDPTGTGMGGSGHKLNAEFSDYAYREGTVGMARASDANSADSQFFICFDGCGHLTGQYTVWGQVLSGMEVIKKINLGQPPKNPDSIIEASLHYNQPTKSESGSVSSAELTAAQKEAERLRQELAALKTEQEQERYRIDSDTQIPLITILSSSSDDRRGSIAGRATDNIGIAEVRVDGAVVPFKSDGSFEWQGFVPAGGLSLAIEAIDTAGLSAMQQVRLERGQLNKAATPNFARLDPFRGKTARKNRNALALVIGVADYKYTSDPALYADKDAEYFHDYAAIKLGVPDKNIFTITNTEADEVSIKKAVKNWLLRMSAKDKTDVYVFFAGHGLASSDGTNMFLLPYDGDPELLEDSAIDRKQLFADIQAISPRSVTVFLDSCYSGGTRAGGTLVASLRPIAIRAKEQNVPEGFTIISAAKGDQTSQSLEEAKHGLFSYFLMRGLEGDADANNDNQITAGELHSFVTDKVERQSGFKQTPDLKGDAERVLVRFQ